METNELQVVRELLRLHPAAAAVADRDGRYPLHHCVASDRLDNEQTIAMAKLLLGFDNSALMRADQEGLWATLTNHS